MTGPSQLGRPWLDHTTIEPAYTGELNGLAALITETFNDEETRGQKRLGETRESITLAGEYDELYAKAQRVVRVMALQRRRWSDLKDEHPARNVPKPTEDDPAATEPHEDDQIGVNVTTFFDAVMPESIVTDDGEQRYTAAECGKFTDELSTAEWNDLCSVVWVLNERGVGVPKSSMVSRLRQRIGDDSGPPSPSESPSTASRGGSRLAGPSTTTQSGT